MTQKLKSFRCFTEDRINEVIVVFGRFQPPTSGHAKLFDAASNLAKGNNYRIYTSQTQDKKKNPLSYSDKIKFLRKIFPSHGRNIISDKEVRTILDALVKVNSQGFTKAKVVVGSDRVDEISSLIKKYNGKDLASGKSYDFYDGLSVVSAGERDPDSDSVSGMSATKMRDAAKNNDLTSFAKGLPKVDSAISSELFNVLRLAMGLKESYIHRKHIQLESVSSLREDYVSGNLFAIGDEVLINETNETGLITCLGPNFVTVNINGTAKRVWLSSIKKEK